MATLSISKDTLFSVGKYFKTFVADQVKAGSYSSASDIVRSGLRLLKKQEVRLTAFVDGEQSGPASPFDSEALS